MPRRPIHRSVGLPCPAIVYAHYVVPTNLMRSLAEAKLIRQTRPSQEGLEDNVREIRLLGDDLFQPLARDCQYPPALAHHGREVQALPGEHVQLAQETAREEDRYRPRLTCEVVDHLHLAFEDDEEVVGGVARPEEDLPGLRLSRLAVATEDLNLVFPERRGPRTANLSGSINHSVPP